MNSATSHRVRTKHSQRTENVQQSSEHEPLDPLEAMRRWGRGENERLAKKRNSFHKVYAPEEFQSRRGIVDGFLWLAERLLVGSPSTGVQHEDHTRLFVNTSSSSQGSVINQSFDTPADVLLFRTSESNGWQRCPAPQCGHMIELTEGCLRVKCLCGTKFCYGCGELWKTCACPLWGDTMGDDEVRQSYDSDEEEAWEVVEEEGEGEAEAVEASEQQETEDVQAPQIRAGPVYYFEEDGITMPGGLFTMIPTKEDRVGVYPSPRTRSHWPTDDSGSNPQNANTGEQGPSNVHASQSPQLDVPAQESSSPVGDSMFFGESGQEDTAAQGNDGPPRYTTIDEGFLRNGHQFLGDDAEHADYGYTSDSTFGNKAHRDSSADAKSMGDDGQASSELLQIQTDQATLGQSIERSGTPNILEDPADQETMSTIRHSARSIDGINSRRDLTDKDPAPRKDSIMNNPEDQAIVDNIRRNPQARLPGAGAPPTTQPPAQKKVAWGKPPTPASSSSPIAPSPKVAWEKAPSVASPASGPKASVWGNPSTPKPADEPAIAKEGGSEKANGDESAKGGKEGAAKQADDKAAAEDKAEVTGGASAPVATEGESSQPDQKDDTSKDQTSQDSTTTASDNDNTVLSDDKSTQPPDPSSDVNSAGDPASLDVLTSSPIGSPNPDSQDSTKTPDAVQNSAASEGDGKEDTFFIAKKPKAKKNKKGGNR